MKRQWIPRLSIIHVSVLLFFATVLCVSVFKPAIAIESPSPSTASVVEISSPETTAAALLSQGQSLYAEGHFAEAARVWEAAMHAAQQTNDISRHIASLNYLTLVYQRLGELELADDSIHQSLALIDRLEHNTELDTIAAGRQLQAQALNALGELHLAMGEPETAIDAWKQAEDAYRQQDDALGAIGSRTNQAQALQMLGFYRQAQALLEEASAEVSQQSESPLKALSLISLGNVLQVTGNLTTARNLLIEGIILAHSFSLNNELSAAQLTLGHVYQALGETDQAQKTYQAAIASTSNPNRQIEAYLGQFNLAVDHQQWDSARSLLPVIQQQLEQLTPSRMGVYAHINFASTLLKTAHPQGPEENPALAEEEPPPSLVSSLDIAHLLNRAVQQARQLNDSQAESYALGELGQVYEISAEYGWADDLTQRALVLSQIANAPEIAYRWQWQLGRIYAKQAIGKSPAIYQGKRVEAIASYTEAIHLLKSVNRELLVTNPEFQFSFRENVEPVYREFADLLLQPGASSNNLQQVREVLEDLQLAELENFFRSACLDVQIQQIDDIDPTAAVIYPLILDDRMEVILSIPGVPLQQYTINHPKTKVDRTLEQMLQSLNPIFSDRTRLEVSKQVYDWLIRPLEPALHEHQMETLVFVLDGFLRNIPMAALYDGEQYLIERYGVALAPGLQLVAASTIGSGDMRVLTAGISEARLGFSALPGVEAEINEISQTFPSDTFLNEDFTTDNLETELANTTFPIVHLATHGQFSSDPEQTFLLSWEDQIHVGELETLVRTRHTESSRPVELLVLSACQTATGDKQATLGLAGFAVRAGAQSTLATLWSVNDESTALFMIQFYHLLSEKPTSSKSNLLREAQLLLLQQDEYRHPFYWAPFVLVGNWL
ncbi:MAG: CHAT domain-containing protein [Cyanobacteria bacterium P01_A01_bin.37]